MRNLKRALSMALAAIMVLGLMVVGASAAGYEDFTDKDEIKNTEAVSTMVSLGVISGKDDGSYDPNGNLTRAEACTLIARMLGGGKDPVLGSNVKSKFTDTQGHWAENYIAYCADKGIIVGVGDGSFNPDGTLTGTAAAKMMLCALGYKPEFEGIGGAVWELKTNTLATDVRLYEGLESMDPSQAINRDQVAQLIYNGVQAQEVYYDNLQGDYSGVLQTFEKGTMLANRFGVVKVEGIVEANEVFSLVDGTTSTAAGKARFVDTNTYRTSDDKDGNHNGVYPVSIPNEYVGQRVVIYVKFPNALAPNAVESTVIGDPILSDKNTVATTGDRLKDTDAVKSFLSDNGLSIGAETVDANDKTAHNGVLAATENGTVFTTNRPTPDDGVNKTAGRKMTFIDNTGDGTVDYIITENPTLAKVTVYNETDKKLTIAGEGSIEFKNIANPEDVAVNDMVLYVKYNDTFYLTKPETVTGAVTAFVNGTPAKVTMDGTNYTQSANELEPTGTTLEKLNASDDLIGNSYIFYLDAYGNVVAKDLYEESFGNYALVIDSAAGTAGGSVLANSGEVKLMLNDGTTAVYKVNMLASAAGFEVAGSTNDAKEQNMAALLSSESVVGQVVTYVVDGNNVTIGDPDKDTNYATQYDFTTGAPEAVKRATASYTINGKEIIVNDNTLFYVRSDSDSSIPGVDRYSVIKGLNNVPVSEITDAKVVGAAYRVRTVDNYTTNTAKAVVVDDMSNSFKGTRNFLYVTGNYTQTNEQIKNNIYEYPVVFENGEKGSVLVKNINNATDEVHGGTPVAIKSGVIYEYSMNGDYAELALTSHTYNNYVTSQVKGKSMDVRLGTNGASTQTKTLGTTVINVEDTDNVYVMDSEPTDAMSVAFATDSDGKVNLVFVRDSDVHFNKVYNWTSGTLTINDVPLASGQYIEVANGFSITVPGATDGTDKLVGYADYTNASATDEWLFGNIKDGEGSLTMVANGIVKIGSTNGGTSFDLTDPSKNTGSGSTTPTGDTYTLTLDGKLASGGATQPVTVWAKTADGETKLTAKVTETSAGATAAYEVPQGAEVIINLTSISDITRTATYTVDGVQVTATDGTSDKITFTMSKALTLNLTVADTFKDGTQVYAITTHNGVTAKYNDGTKDVVIPANATTYIPSTVSTLNITSVGDGNAVITGKSAASTTPGTDYFNLSNATVSITGDTDLYAAIKVTVSTADVQAANTADSISITNSAAKYVALDEVLTISNTSSATYTGYVVTADASVKHSADANKTYTVSGNKDVTIVGAYQITLNDGVKATYGSTVEVASGSYVDATQSLTLAAADTTNQGVLKNGAIYGAGESSATLSADTAFGAGTKVTLVATSGTTKSIEKLFFENAAGQDETIDEGDDTNQIVYVKAGQVVEVFGVTKNATGKVIKLTGVEATNSLESTASTNSWATFTIGTTAITVEEVAKG